ncbi:quinone-dependent dihydroorotate dehydrogenase [Arcobacter sp. FWKO B]|uniref:quinone-dependent dihydroorotate dehydrogenase n=1 Tax=Arcobacter sp. FWKO B TaxID=2593672 RepID=UPI0018A69F2C|nr:quinone-dependent dihydroorotate dehydrogenase [Arcobacter sp. FWKO B]QOG13186.1 quinone-dependent dihydroorotate dehydrogenase [Arcobacter sp. FWKO B]
MFDYNSVKKVLFKFDPETAHTIGEFGLKLLPKCSLLNNFFVEKNFITSSALRQDILGIHFENPVGLGAGFDKNATMVEAMPALGFGFTEIGTVTPKPQSGNPKPRLFRYPEQNSIQNAMGFNNLGAYVISQNVKKVYPFSIPVGINIGKNKATAEIDAMKDYETLIRTFEHLGDYLVVNISSPNTPNLRDLQNEEFIKNTFYMAKSITKKPIFLKIAPDMEASVAIDICNCAISNGADGIIATNTTIDYTLLPNPQNFGGISGEVLKEKSFNLFKEIAKELYGKTILISVGGISTAEDAYERIKVGASLVQVYSGLIFKGPSMVGDINRGLIELLKKDGFSHISQAIGIDLKTNN